jgi:hypothetical protein
MTAVRDDPGIETDRDRPALSARALALSSALGAAALVVVAYVAYRELIHYDRRAIEHVPAGAEFALRVDLEQLVLFEPVRKHLLPLVDRAPLVPPGAEPARVPRLLRLREEAGLNLVLDLRELVFARNPDGRWVLALGGLFGSRRLLPRIEEVLRREPGLRLHREAAMLVLDPSGLALGQAEDGVLLVGSEAATLERALHPSRAHEQLGLPPNGAAALAALPSWFDSVESQPQRALRPASWVRSIVRLDFGDPLELTLRIEHSAASDVASMRRLVEGWFAAPSDRDFVPGADWGGERAILARAQFATTSTTETVVTSTWERSEFDHAARSLATWLEGRFETGRPAAQ